MQISRACPIKYKSKNQDSHPEAPVPDTKEVFAEGGVSLDVSHGSVMTPE